MSVARAESRLTQRLVAELFLAMAADGGPEHHGSHGRDRRSNLQNAVPLTPASDTHAADLHPGPGQPKAA